MKILHGRYFRQFRAWLKKRKFIILQTSFLPIGLLYYSVSKIANISSWEKFKIEKLQKFTPANIDCFTV